MKKIIIIVSKKDSFYTSGVGKYILSYIPFFEKDFNINFIFQPSHHNLISGYLWRLFKLPKILKKNYYDDIKIFYDESFLLSTRKWMNNKSIMIVHHTYQFSVTSLFDFIFFILSYIWFNFFLNNSNNIVAVSKNTANDIIKNNFVNKNKINIISNSIDIKNVDKISFISKDEFISKYWLPKNKKILLIVASTETRKNIPTILKVLSKLWEDYIVVRLWKTSPWNQSTIIENLILNFHLENRYFVFSWVNDIDMYHFYKYSYCLLCPSLFEWFWRPIIEAQSVGCPVISTNKWWLKEVTNNSCFIINNPNDIEEWLFNILNIQKYNLIEDGYKNIQNYNTTKLATNWINLLNSIK